MSHLMVNLNYTMINYHLNQLGVLIKDNKEAMRIHAEIIKELDKGIDKDILPFIKGGVKNG